METWRAWFLRRSYADSKRQARGWKSVESQQQATKQVLSRPMRFGLIQTLAHPELALEPTILLPISRELHNGCSILPILAYMQVKTLHTIMVLVIHHIIRQNGTYWVAIWPVSPAQTCCFGSPNSTFRNSLNIRRLAKAPIAVAINIKMLTNDDLVSMPKVRFDHGQNPNNS